MPQLCGGKCLNEHSLLDRRPGQHGRPARSKSRKDPAANGAPPRAPAHIVDRTLTPLAAQCASVSLKGFEHSFGAAVSPKTTMLLPDGNGRSGALGSSLTRATMRKLNDDIKAHHGEKAKIHVFPAIPVSVAIELGRARMPKSDLPLLVYDNIRETSFLAAPCLQFVGVKWCRTAGAHSLARSSRTRLRRRTQRFLRFRCRRTSRRPDSAPTTWPRAPAQTTPEIRACQSWHHIAGTCDARSGFTSVTIATRSSCRRFSSSTSPGQVTSRSES